MIFSAALEATKQALENVGIDHQLQCEIFKVGTVYLEISIDVGNSDERLKKNDEQLDAASEVHTSKTCDIRSVISRLSDISKSGNDL